MVAVGKPVRCLSCRQGAGRLVLVGLLAICSAGLMSCASTQELYAQYDEQFCPVDGQGLTVPATATDQKVVERVVIKEVPAASASMMTWEPAVYYKSDSTKLSRSAKRALDANVSMLQKFPRHLVAIRGFTDARSSEEYNRKLAQRRIAGVKKYLTGKLGLSGSVAANDSGMMVIDLFADPTQLGEGDGLGPRIAEDVDLHCPDTIDKETMNNNKVLATSCMIDLLRASGEFEYVEKDFIFDHQFARRPVNAPAPVAFGPDDTLWDLQWNFRNNGTGPLQSKGGAGFADFWSRTGITGSTDVTVAVVDTGLVMSHPDIANSPNIAPGWDMVSDPEMGNDGDGRDNDPNDPGDLCNPNVPFARDSFHGTHVAGTIGAAASNNSAGIAGGAWTVKIVPVRALGKCGGRLSDIIEAIRWAGGTVPAEDALGNEVWNENPADIINLSIGLFEICPASLQDAIDSVVERGAVVVSAAGNARLPAEFYAPGGCNNVISVAASDGRGHIAPYSNFGPEVDLLAPGGDLLRDDDGDGRPDGILSTKPSEDCYDPLTGDAIDSCNYAYEQGTSMAAPHASAALALLAAQNPDFTGAQLEATLMSALTPRETDQCSAPCAQYPGATPIPDSDGMCVRTCGAGLLNLEKLPN